jgi:hypothetical protein
VSGSLFSGSGLVQPAPPVRDLITILFKQRNLNYLEMENATFFLISQSLVQGYIASKAKDQYNQKVIRKIRKIEARKHMLLTNLEYTTRWN